MTAGTVVRYRYTVVVVMTLALAACGGGGGGAAPTVQEDKARADRMVLTEADFPDLTRQDDDTETDESDPFRKCLNGNQVLIDLEKGPRAASSTFNDDEENHTRSSAVSLAETESLAKAAFAEVNRTTFVSCFDDAIRAGFESEVGGGIDLKSLEVAELPVDKHGDETVAYRADVEIASVGQTLALRFDYIFFRVDRVVAVLFSFDVGDGFDAVDRNRLSKVLTERVKDEL